jgi:murein DD-endopeptidase MepM/ murein hydrolase activator NlpD
MILPKNAPYPGGVIVKEIEIDEDFSAYLDDKRVAVVKDGKKSYVVAGIGLDETRKFVNLTIKTKSHEYPYLIKILPKSYKKEYITLKSNKRVDLSKEDLDRHYKEKSEVKKILSSYSKDFYGFDFIKPLSGRISGEYGKRRYFNKKPRKPHSGIDIAAKRGSGIKAANSGVVKLTKELFFNGKTILIDHGFGVVSMYCHLSKFRVKKGDFVKKGQIIGEVGSSGRATGPHLHFGISLNEVFVNPKLFIDF